MRDVYQINARAGNAGVAVPVADEVLVSYRRVI